MSGASSDVRGKEGHMQEVLPWLEHKGGAGGAQACVEVKVGGEVQSLVGFVVHRGVPMHVS